MESYIILNYFKKYTFIIRFLFLNHSSIFELITTLQDDEDDNEKDDNNNVWDSDNEDVEWKPGKDKVMKLFIDFMSLILTLLFIFSHILPFYFFEPTLPPLFNLFFCFFLSLILFFLSHSLTLSPSLSIYLSVSHILSLSIYLSICLSHSLSLSHTYKHKLLPPYFVPSISFSPLSSLQPTSYEPEGPMGRLLRAVNESDFPPGMSDSE